MINIVSVFLRGLIGLFSGLLRLVLVGVLTTVIALGAFVNEKAGEPMGDVGNLGNMTYGEFMSDRWAAIREAEPKCQIGSVASFVTLVPAFSVFYTSLAVYPGWYPRSSTTELVIGNTTIVNDLPIEWNEVPDTWWAIVRYESWSLLGRTWTDPGPKNFPGWCRLRLVQLTASYNPQPAVIPSQ